MRDVIIISSAKIDLFLLTKMLRGRDPLLTNDGGRLWIGVGDGVEIKSDPSLSVHYEDEEGDCLLFLGRNPNFYLASFKNIDDIRVVLSELSELPELVVDNDFGIVESISRFVQRWSDDGAWDWIA